MLQSDQMNPFRDIRAVFFDLFDTLVEIDPSRLPKRMWQGVEHPTTAPLVFERLQKEMPELTFEKFIAAMIESWKETTARKEADLIEVSAIDRHERFLRGLGLPAGEKTRALALTLTDVHMRAIAQSTRPVLGAEEILVKLKAAGLPLVLISNFDHAPAGEWVLENTKLSGFSKIIISDALGLRKPHEKLFQEALSHAGVAPSEALHVGDMPKADVWGAGRLGIRTAWINPKGKPYPEKEHAPDITVAGIAELLGHLP